jgi:eukaryotic-like serine/threonine-protein kinase
MKPVKNVQTVTLVAPARGVPSAGQLIGDRYRLDRPLERGAMGSVWRAEQVRLRAPVAVKFLDPSLIGDREMHDRFIQEARSAAAVRSAHVVQVFDYGSEGGVPYIAMELLDGENLDARLTARGTLTPAELAKLFSELARGVGQAHAIGVIHRDLKPGNIFLAREGEHEVTKIVDFGIAKVKASALRLTQGIGTQLGTLLGTPQYMSPEQVRGSAIDHRTDLWALGVIACECLTGRCPFSGATIGDLTVQICTERPPAPSSLGPVPPGFDQWFFRATHKKPSKRFQSAEEMSSRLMAVLGPAVLNGPSGARAGRFMALPSRSEVRFAYSAVVTWKGSVMTRLGQGFAAFRQVMQQVLEQLSAHWEVARQKARTLLESERFRFMRPLVERHGLFVSVSLLCCGILLLGLTSRNGDPGNAEVSSPTAAEEVTLGLQSASAREAVAGEPASAPASPAPASPAPASPALAAPGGASGAPVPAPSEAVPAPTATAPTEARADGTLEAHGAEPLQRAHVSPSAAPAASHDARTEKAETTAPEKADAVAAETEKPKLITKAMAQAAAKILNADELVASLPASRGAQPGSKPATPVAPKAPVAAPRAASPVAASKPAPRAPSAPAKPAPRAPARSNARPSQTQPFDDRL